MKFVQVNPDEIEALGSDSTRGGLIGPMIKSFLETGYYMVEIDCKEIGRKAASVSASVAAFSRNHILPVRPVLRGPRFFMQRRDVTKEGTPIPDWKDELLKIHVGLGDGSTPIEFEAVPLKSVGVKK